MRRYLIIIAVVAFAAVTVFSQKVTQGTLEVVSKDGKITGMVPLKHTDVEAEITGFLSRVTVKQQFENGYDSPIEAVYVFPLPQNAAVDSLVMKIGERTIRGKIMKRDEAREAYEAAKSNGQIASLLDQERPNIFTQSVANVVPGEKITIEISYVQTLKYEDGAYKFVFPMVVGPRYIPGKPTGKDGTGYAPDTDKVPDGSKVTPHVAKGRAGHDISLRLRLDAGVPVTKVTSESHEIGSQMLSASSYEVELASRESIPNKDFVLRYEVAGSKIEDAILAHHGANGGFFTLILQPPDKVNTEDVTPKEIVFVLDTSGSMSGFPIEKAKEAMKMALEGLNPYDTFNLITFAGDTHVLFNKPVAATAENLRLAQAFLRSRKGGGGTEMMKAIKTALEPSDSQDHIRVVCFMTDGYIGNDMAILGEIKNHPNARVFSFGIGNSVNRYLLERMAQEGRGEAEFVSLKDDGTAAAKRFYKRVRSPILTDISLEFSGVQVADIYPKRINDLFSAKPVIIQGRYKSGGKGVVRLTGKSFGREIVREIPVNFPKSEPRHTSLETLWARARIADLMSEDYRGIQNGNPRSGIKEAITNLGLEFRLMTQYTSFVAVEERVVTDGSRPMTIEVPVETPDGVSYEGVFGESKAVGYAGGGGRNRGFSGSAITGHLFKRRLIRGSKAPPMRIDDRGSAEEKAVYADLKAKELPAPLYPADTSLIDAVVNVTIDIGPDGKVIKAIPSARDPKFAQAAVEAALKATFEVPETIQGVEQVRALAKYRFTKDRKAAVDPSVRVLNVRLKPNKFHSDVKALVERISKGKPVSGSESGFVNGGRASLIVRVKKLDPASAAALKRAGFRVITVMASAKAVVGSIKVTKIVELANLDSVTFISPQRR